jgi:hypothetical protein
VPAQLHAIDEPKRRTEPPRVQPKPEPGPRDAGLVGQWVLLPDNVNLQLGLVFREDGKVGLAMVNGQNKAIGIETFTIRNGNILTISNQSKALGPDKESVAADTLEGHKLSLKFREATLEFNRVKN